MATSYYGVDSVTPINQLIATVESYFGATPKFFGRYVQPSPYEGLNQDSSAEASSAHSYGVGYILPVTSPNDVTGTQQTGKADGNAACGNVRTAIDDANSHLALPTNYELYLYLDVEGSLGSNYWIGWSDAVEVYYDSHSGTYPYFPSCYTNAYSGNCSVLCNNGYTWSVWASEPSYSSCSDCAWGQQSWGSQNHCTSCSTFYTVVWQYIQQGACLNCHSNFPDVDLDITTPGQDQTAYMLRVQ